MTHQHRDRPLKKPDLTRWNRAGLSKFDYIDGDAAVWLEELRIAMLGLYMEGAPAEQRTPEHWRDAFLNPDPTDWPDLEDAAKRVKWKRLAPPAPARSESRGRRSKRLLDQYNEHSQEYAWEINRAMARASHVLLGTLNAYANEGYLRSATQWDNLRRLAAMVNYQPTPPASATTTLSLTLKDGIDAVEVQRGLAMKHTPPQGGAPLIFETLTATQAHPNLNAARSEGWNRNTKPVKFSDGATTKSVSWHLSAKDNLAPGDLVVIASGSTGDASSITTISQNAEAQIADILLSSVPVNSYAHWHTRLFTAPDDVRIGEPVSKTGAAIIKVATGGYTTGDLVKIIVGGVEQYVEIIGVEGGELVLKADLGDATEVEILPMLPFDRDVDGKFVAPKDFTKMHFNGINGVFDEDGEEKESDGTWVAQEFTPSNALKTDRGFVVEAGAATVTAKVKPTQPPVLPTKPELSKNTISFAGKPPKNLKEGAWFIARDIDSNDIQAVQVAGLGVSSGEYHIVFSQKISTAPEETEFHGPMTLELPPLGYDYSTDNALIGGLATLEQIPETARVLLKPGRKMIITRAFGEDSESVLTTLSAITPLSADRVELAITPPEAAAGWEKGGTSFHLNTAEISHGETKDQRILGSGDGEQPRQSFDLPLADVSHIPSSATEAGVVPDIDIAVDGTRWDYRDFIDPTAENTRSWSTTLKDDGKLTIHFRRRLLTGQNNLRVARVRVGSGLKGTDIAPFSFQKPMKKDRYVAALHQPFPTSGGADREPTSKLRTSAPARLSANGRAVSLKDFQSLAERHASVLRAHAEVVPSSDAIRKISLTLAPIGGGDLTKTLEDNLRPAILEKSLPGTRISFRSYITLPLYIGATVRSDLTVNDRSDIKAAVEEKLVSTFSLEARAFAQTAYISEVLGAIETVAGVENAIATRFDLGDSYTLLDKTNSPVQDPWPRNVATRDGTVAAIYATNHQIIHIPAASAGTIAIVVEDIR